MTRFYLNGHQVETKAVATARLLDVLREEFQLMGSKEGCGEGECGACNILMNGMLQASCLIPIGSIQEASIITIEGYKDTNKYNILSKCYAEAGAVQCGFCTPGMMMASEALLLKIPHPTEAEIREGISGNLCRCTGYNMIVEAIHLASEVGDGLW